jgi:Holliday junction resolvase
MSNPSKEKGTRAEHLLVKLLEEYTGLPFKRVPLSGASIIKGDIFLSNERNTYCIEVKSYKESAINHLLVSGVGKPLTEWIDQTLIQAEKMNIKPLLFFKHDRSPFYVCSWDEPANVEIYLIYQYNAEELPVYIMDAKMWLRMEIIKWVT